MHTVSIPDPLYVEAQRAADATGISLECYVREAVELHLGDGPSEPEVLKLSPEQVAGLRTAQASIAAGKGLTVKQLERSLAEKKAAWLQANRH
jgi:hypothetical protein